jgi:hypothetical protein
MDRCHSCTEDGYSFVSSACSGKICTNNFFVGGLKFEVFRETFDAKGELVGKFFGIYPCWTFIDPHFYLAQCQPFMTASILILLDKKDFYKDKLNMKHQI